MALNTLKCNHLTPLGLKGLNNAHAWQCRWTPGRQIVECTYIWQWLTTEAVMQ